MESRNALYPLSADPVHNGHLRNLTTVLEQRLFDHVCVAVAHNPEKKHLLPVEERVRLTEIAIRAAGWDATRASVIPLSGLARTYAAINGYPYLLRAVRDATDAAYEITLADVNAATGVQTIFLPADARDRAISSTIVKALASEGASVEQYVHPAIKQALEERLRGVTVLGVSGNSGAGKTTLCRELAAYATSQGVNMAHIDVDMISREQYSGDAPLQRRVRERIESEIAPGIFTAGGFDRVRLAAVVFGDDAKREQLAEILRVPVSLGIEEQLRSVKGIALIDAAYLAEYHMLPRVNYHVLLVDCDSEVRRARIVARDNIDAARYDARSRAQHTPDERRQIVLAEQARVRYGTLLETDTTYGTDIPAVFDMVTRAFPATISRP